jgi:hypothetical protein
MTNTQAIVLPRVRYENQNEKKGRKITCKNVKKNKEIGRCKLSSVMDEIFTLDSFGGVKSLIILPSRWHKSINTKSLRNCGHGQETILFGCSS